MELYEIFIDGKCRVINPLSFYNFLNLTEDDYIFVCSSNTYANIPLPEFIYALFQYCNLNPLLRKEFQARLTELETMELVDYEAINKYQETRDSIANHYTLNPQLLKDLDSIMEQGTNKFHKFLLVYQEVAKRFIYDESYFANQKEALTKHQDINYLKKITYQNNKVVCFEIIAILAYYLRKLGFNYELLGGDTYGNHTVLRTRFEEYLLEIEPVTSVFHNDLTNLKIKRPLVGIKSFNKNRETKERFKVMLSFYYQEQKKDYYSGFLPANKIITSNQLPSAIKEGLRFLDLALLKIKTENLEVMDAMCYLLFLLDNYKYRSDLTKLTGEIVNDTLSPVGFSVLIIMHDFLAGTYYALYNFQETKVLTQVGVKTLFESEILSPYDVKRKIYGI